MKERVKHLCREKEMTMKALAEKMNIASESLARSLTGNPTLSTIKSIANALDIPIWKLFSDESSQELTGFIEYAGRVYRIKSKHDLEKVLSMLNENHQ